MGAKKVKPLSDRVVVKPLDEDEQMRGGLYIPDTAKEKPSQGEIVAVGPGKLSDDGTRLDMDVSVGDRSSMASTAVPMSRWKVRSTSSFVSLTFSRSYPNR